MIRFIYISAILALGAVLPALPVQSAQAQIAPVGNKPLVVMRFNQRQVYYERQLFIALERAVAVKPSVEFALTSFIPQGPDSRAAADHAARARANTNRVLQSLAEMGVPRSRIRVSEQSDSALRYHEVHLFVF